MNKRHFKYYILINFLLALTIVPAYSGDQEDRVKTQREKVVQKEIVRNIKYLNGFNSYKAKDSSFINFDLSYCKIVVSFSSTKSHYLINYTFDFNQVVDFEFYKRLKTILIRNGAGVTLEKTKEIPINHDDFDEDEILNQPNKVDNSQDKKYSKRVMMTTRRTSSAYNLANSFYEYADLCQ